MQRLNCVEKRRKKQISFVNLSRIECKTDKLKHERSKAKTDPQVWYRIYTKGEQFATKTKGLHDILMRNRFELPEFVFDEIKNESFIAVWCHGYRNGVDHWSMPINRQHTECCHRLREQCHCSETMIIFHFFAFFINGLSHVLLSVVLGNGEYNSVLFILACSLDDCYTIKRHNVFISKDGNLKLGSKKEISCENQRMCYIECSSEEFIVDWNV